MVAKVRGIEVMMQGGQTFIRAPQWTDSRSLVASTAESYSISGLRTAAGLATDAPLYVIFSSGGKQFFAKYYGGTATVNSADTADGSGCDDTPTQRYLGNDITAISLIAPADTVVTMSFFTN